MGAPALRRAADDENKQGKVTVRYPRGAQAEKEHHEQALAALKRARTPEDALAVVLRLLVAQRLADTAGLPGADRQGVYEPRELAGSEVLGKLAARVAPPSVKRHLAEQEAERERREQACQERAGRPPQRAAREARSRRIVRCACCLGPIESAPKAAEKHGASSTQATASSSGAAPTTTTRRPAERASRPSAASTNLDSRRDTDASFDP